MLTLLSWKNKKLINMKAVEVTLVYYEVGLLVKKHLT